MLTIPLLAEYKNYIWCFFLQIMRVNFGNFCITAKNYVAIEPASVEAKIKDNLFFSSILLCPILIDYKSSQPYKSHLYITHI